MGEPEGPEVEDKRARQAPWRGPGPIPDAAMEFVRKHFAETIPYNNALGLRIVDIVSDGVITELPYNPELIGNPETGFLHGGAITSLIDASCGTAVAVHMRRPIRMATLDLRIDYLKPAPPGQSVFCRATCFRTTKNIAFVRATADCGDEHRPVAAASGSFVIFHDKKSDVSSQ